LTAVIVLFLATIYKLKVNFIKKIPIDLYKETILFLLINNNR
jgi:hypothetical protein